MSVEMLLYNKLRDNKHHNITCVNMEKLAYYLSQLNKKDQEICLMLIFEKYSRDKKVIKLQQRALPYKGNTILKDLGAKFTISNFPQELIEVLMSFVEIGTNSILFEKSTT